MGLESSYGAGVPIGGNGDGILAILGACIIIDYQFLQDQ